LNAPLVESAVVKDLARRMVLAAAPEERHTFGPVSDRYLADPDRFGRGRRGSGRLGFDPTGVAVVLVAPVALAAAMAAVEYVVESVAKAAVERTTEATRRVVRRIFGLAADDGDTPRVPLGPEQLREVYEIVVGAARSAGLPDDTAELMAGAVVGQMQLPKEPA
jgi:hypothetical protein